MENRGLLFPNLVGLPDKSDCHALQTNRFFLCGIVHNMPFCALFLFEELVSVVQAGLPVTAQKWHNSCRHFGN